MDKKLTKQELRRYSRHLVLPEVGIEGQELIKKSKVLVVGAGGLGSPTMLYLAAAGVGTIGIVDFDKVDESNIQRQIVHDEDNVGKKKTESAKKAILRSNPHTKVELHDVKLSSKNALKIIKKYDIVIDGSDNFPTKYMVNDACVLLKKPLVYGSIFRFDGHISVFNFENGPCYRCLFPQPPPRETAPSCAEAGVLGVLPGVIGTIQATEALKIILRIGNIMSGRFLVYNALNMSFKELKLKKNDNCKICGNKPEINELIDYEQFCNAQDNSKNEKHEIFAKELLRMKNNNEDFILVDVREKWEWDVEKIEDAVLIPLSKIQAGKLSDIEKIEKSEKMVLYCKTGGRSLAALKLITDLGYNNVVSLKGGIDSWMKETNLELSIK